MIRTGAGRRAVALAVVALATLAFAAAACGDDDEEAGGTATAAPTQAASPAAASPTAGAAQGGLRLQVTAADGTQILTDGAGRSLYTFNNDTAGSGQSACNGGCANAWPPFTVETGGAEAVDVAADVTGEVGTITRDDGATQVTYKGMPLYYFANDTAPGDTNGKAVPNWALATP